jgi:hypothetical protein
MEHENLGIDANGEATSGVNHEGESTDRSNSALNVFRWILTWA